MQNLTAIENQNKEELDGSFSNQTLIEEIEKLRKLSNTSTVYLKISQIKISDSFSKIFPINTEMLQILENSMKDTGFDSKHPLFIWQKNNQILDGHTRLQAAKNIGIEEVPVIFIDFPNEKDVKEYIYTLQFQRRNMSVPDRLQFLINYIQENGKPQFFRDWIAKMFRISTGTATKYVRLAESNQTNEFEKLLQGTLTLNKAYESLLKKDNLVMNERQKQLQLRTASFDYYFKKVQTLPLKTRNSHLKFLKYFVITLIDNQLLNKKISQEILQIIDKNIDY